MKRASKIASFFLFPLVVFLVHLAVKGQGLYELFPNVDIPFHFRRAFDCVYVRSGSVLSRVREDHRNATQGPFLLLLFSLTTTVTVFWEFAEFISDQRLHTNLQPSIANTMQDQFLGILGGGTWVVIYLREYLASRVAKKGLDKTFF